MMTRQKLCQCGMLLTVIVSTAAAAFGQYSDLSICPNGQSAIRGRNDFLTRPDPRPSSDLEMDWRVRQFPRAGYRYHDDSYAMPDGSNLRTRSDQEWRSDDYRRLLPDRDYRSRMNNAVSTNFRDPVPAGYDSLFTDREDSLDRDNNSNRLSNPFRLPSRSEEFNPYHETSSRRHHPDSMERRFRVPFDRMDWRMPTQREFDPTAHDAVDYSPAPRSDEFSRPVRDDVPSDYDPLIPVPLPRRQNSDQADTLRKQISNRYSDPVTVRSVRAMSTSQAAQLFREVSQQTDERHLEPSPYDLRVRRALRNLVMAVETPAFTQSLGISGDSFRIDGFRNSLSRISDSMRVTSISDAEQVMQVVMQEARTVPGLTGNIIAFEFTNATVDTLDKFSALEPEEPVGGRSASLDSEIVGIGVEVKTHTDGLLIMKTLRDGPAAAAGLRKGDIITAIDGRVISGMSMPRAVDLMKGSVGTRIRLGIVRDGNDPGTVALTRQRVRVWTVNDVRKLSGTTDVGYLSLSQFGQTSTQELDQALQQLHRQGMKSLVLDLRGNPGGLLTTCVEITNRFLPCGTIVSTKGRLSSDNMHETASYDRTWNTPLVVLIDGDSASASEIFAAAVQDNGRGIVVGQKSYGKGTVQTHFPLNSISGNLRLTTARFYSPSGRPMSGQGVTPDVLVTDDDGIENGDRMLQAAVRLAQSRQARELAASASKCRTNATPLIRNSFNDNMYDESSRQTVLR